MCLFDGRLLKTDAQLVWTIEKQSGIEPDTQVTAALAGLEPRAFGGRGVAFALSVPLHVDNTAAERGYW